jgi:hypothetical protein
MRMNRVGGMHRFYGALAQKMTSVLRDGCLLHPTELLINWANEQRFDPIDRIPDLLHHTTSGQDPWASEVQYPLHCKQATHLIATGRLGLFFMVPGMDETLPVNGLAVLSTDLADLAHCVDARRTPVLVIRMTVESVYLHCAKAFMRSQLWDAERHTDRAQLLNMGEMMRDQIRAFKGEEIEVETKTQMVTRYQQTL